MYIIRYTIRWAYKPSYNWGDDLVRISWRHHGYVCIYIYMYKQTSYDTSLNKNCGIRDTEKNVSMIKDAGDLPNGPRCASPKWRFGPSGDMAIGNSLKSRNGDPRGPKGVFRSYLQFFWIFHCHVWLPEGVSLKHWDYSLLWSARLPWHSDSQTWLAGKINNNSILVWCRLSLKSRCFFKQPG